ncbi:MAG: glycosyltransferase family 4 protein [Pseudomonadota bacterium]|nr:glycosyltransferase family 4 protein [Pseudomonadota bacterium]
MTEIENTTPIKSRPVILQVLPSLETGGAEKGCIDVAKAITESGGIALVASSGGKMVRDLDRAGVHHINMPVNTKNPLRMHMNVNKLISVIRDFNVDIVHARSRAPAWSCYKACNATKTHFITTFHGTYNISSGLKRHYNSIMTRGEPVIAISRFIAEHMKNEYQVNSERIRLIYRGVDIESYNPSAVTAGRIVQLAEKWRLTDGVPVIILPGRLTRWKGQSVLIKALAELGEMEFRCLLVGDDQGRSGYRQELISLVKKLRLGSKVHFVGHCDDMPAAYMLADVVISASTDPEAFGRVMVEGQALGKPVIGADHGASRELILPNETGWLVPPNKTSALASMLKHVLSLDTPFREELASRAISNVRANFTRAQMCAKTVDVYYEVLG